MTDQEFTEYLIKEYGIQAKRLPELISVVRMLRDTVPASGSPHRNKNKDFNRIIQAPVEAIHIETSEGVIHLDKKDPLFQYFNRSIKIVQGNFNKELNKADKQWQKKLSEMAEKTIFNFFDTYCEDTEMMGRDGDSMIGECLRHFEILKRTHIKTRDEWVEDWKSTHNYPDYLHDIVKSRRKKFRKD